MTIPFVETQPTDLPMQPAELPQGIPLQGLQAALEAHTAAINGHAGQLKRLIEVLKDSNKHFAAREKYIKDRAK
jgi:uncharacterized coiled-coil protein SlyX